MKHARKPFRAPFLALALLTAPLVAGLGDWGVADAVPTEYRSAALHGDWSAAAAVAQRLATRSPERADLALYLEARALARAKRGADALVRLANIAERHPDSAWRHQARFLEAQLVGEDGSIAAAHAIWDAEVERLRSPERKGELVQRLLDIARERAKAPAPGDPSAAPADFESARALLARALELDPPRALEDRARFELAQALVGLGRHAEAAQALREYLQRFDPDEARSSAARAGAGLHVFAARLALGRALLASGQRVHARHVFEDLGPAAQRARAGEGGWEGAALDAEQRAELAHIEGEAAFERHATFVAQGEEGLLAIGALRTFLERFPAHARASEAEFLAAERLEQLGRGAEALAAYAAFIERAAPEGANEVAREAHARRRREAHFAQARVLAAQERFAEARTAFEAYLGHFPSGERWSEAQRAVLDTQLGLVTVLRREGRFAEARAAIARFLEEHPLDPRAALLALELGESFVEEADRRADEATAQELEGLLRAALAQWQTLPAKYPGSQEASRALLRRGELLERRLGELAAAVEAYRAVTFGSSQNEARLRLGELLTESLALVTERTHRSGEPARVKLQTRNLEHLRIDVFALDLEAYFAKHRTHLGIERLDLDLIAPDHTRELELADYQAYAPLERELDLGLEGPGVWAVAVSAGALRATTLVLRSDLELILKSSTREAFVFVQDMQRDAPAAGVEVLFALDGEPNGTPGLVRRTTDAQGIARLGFDTPRASGEVRVLALLEGHAAADGLGLAGLELGVAPVPRGLVYSDRPVYRAGHTVRWRAILREVEDGSLVPAAGSLYDVEVQDPAGRALQVERSASSEFGTLHGAFELPVSAPTGTYAIAVRSAQGHAFGGSFSVQPYSLQRVELVLEPERDVVFRGETALLIAKARFLHGEPLVEAPLRVDLPDGRSLELVTDAEGQARIELPTRDFVAEGPLRFVAFLPEEGIGAEAAVYLALREFSLRIELGPEVVQANERFPLLARVVGADGAPLERELTLRILRRVSGPGGTWSELPVQEQRLASNAEGEARATLALERGGSYVLRVEAIDRFGNPIQAQQSLTVAGEGDEARLRWLAENVRVEEGQDLELVLFDRDGGGLALVTFETETVLGHALVELRQGRHHIPFEVLAAYAPNVVVAAACIDGRELATARIELEVRRDLEVRIELEGERHLPGERARARVTARDGLGRPVRAEFSLAIVDEALLLRHPDGLPSVLDFFAQGGRRAAGLVTSSSCTFRYEGLTVRVADALLAEAARRQAAADWELRRGEVLGEMDDWLLGKGESAPQSPTVLHVTDQAGEELIAEEEQLIGARLGGRRSLRTAGGANEDGAYKGPGDTAPPSTPEQDLDTAFWIANLVTDERGEAALEFELPERSTRWRLVTRGADAGVRFGEAQTTLVARAELAAELRVPMVATEGDRPRIVARLFAAGLVGDARLALRVRQGEKVQTLTAALRLDGRAVVEHVFPALEALPSPGAGASDEPLVLELEVEAALPGRSLKARARESVPTQPFGVEHGDAISGILRDPLVRELVLPFSGNYSARQLELHVGIGFDSVLLEEALGETQGILRRCIWVPPDPAGDLIGVARLMRHWKGRSGSAERDLVRLRERGAALLAELVAAQPLDGGGSNKSSDVLEERAARTLWALFEARESGLSVPPALLDAAIAQAQRALRGVSQRSVELEAPLLHALALHGQGDFSVANRLHRQRASLSGAVLAHTALALAAMDSANLAGELMDVLEGRLGLVGGQGRTLFHGSALEMPALMLLALERVSPRSTIAESLVAELLAARPWSMDRARGLAVAALAARRIEEASAGEPYEVRLRVAGRPEVLLQLSPRRPHDVARIDLGPGPAGALRIELAGEGRGAPHYKLVLVGVHSDVSPRPAPGFQLGARAQLAPPPSFEGRPLPVGFSVLERFETPWTNEVRELGLGARTTLRLGWNRRIEASVPREQRAPLLLDLPLPAGARVLPGGVRGGEAHELRDGRVLFHLGQAALAGWVEVDLVGIVPGRYRVPPPVLFDGALPRTRAVGAAGELVVLARGEESSDPYRATPDEEHARGLALFGAGRSTEAAQILAKLHEIHGAQLREAPLRELAWVLLRAYLAAGDAPRIVGAFELVRERDPERVLSSADVLAAARAYAALDEHERSLRLLRAVIEESFVADLDVVRALEGQRETASAFQLQDTLLMEYPELAIVRRSHLDLALRLRRAAPNVAQDPSLRRAELDRAGLMLRAVLLQERFLAFHPRDPLAPEAGLELVDALFTLRDYARAAHLCAELAAAQPAPKHRDAFLYAGALARWELGELEQARALFTAVADARYTDERGNVSLSPNHRLARYVLGQIAHSLGDAETALEHYRAVESDFPDARAELEALRREELSLDEVTSGVPGTAIELELHHRNVERVELLVYAVDLLSLYLREKDLSQVQAVELAGIEPALRRTIELEPGPQLRPRSTRVPLTLAQPGAYLVIARGAERFASGLVLASDLELDVRENAAAGSLRVQAFERRGRTGEPTFAAGVDVRVVGSTSGQILSGTTDRRGLYAAENLSGLATVIARRGDHYAFHRGDAALGAIEGRGRNKLVAPGAAPSYLEHLQNLRSSGEESSRQALEADLSSPRGVRAGELN